MKDFAEHKGIVRAATLGGLKLNLGSMYGTIAGDASSDVNSKTPADFDGGKYTGGAKFGYFGKLLARDISMARHRSEYCRRKKHDPWRVYLFDAFKVDANGGYGSVVEDADGEDNFTTAEDWSFQVGFSYELPLDRVFGEPLPQY